MHPSAPFDATLVGARMLTPFVRELVFERADGEPFAYDAGQWVNLVLPLPGGETKRAYSIASAPSSSHSPRFEVAVTKVSGGAGSDYLHALPLGATLRAIGPQGLFTRAGDHAPSLFVATGTGVTPLRAMIQAAIDKGEKAPLSLLFGARIEADVLYREEFERMQQDSPFFRYAITLSQADDGWTGKRGYVQAHLGEAIEELRARAAAARVHVYACGLERMVKAVRELARQELGVDRKEIHTERYD